MLQRGVSRSNGRINLVDGRLLRPSFRGSNFICCFSTKTHFSNLGLVMQRHETGNSVRQLTTLYDYKFSIPPFSVDERVRPNTNSRTIFTFRRIRL